MFVEDDIGNEHSKLDKDLANNSVLSHYFKTRTKPKLHHLLATIIECTEERFKGKFDEKYANLKLAREFLDTHPEVAELLDEAWDDGVFKKIRLLSESPPQSLSVP